ncbi:uncharacterized protein LTR77_002469 [Saxophila tyrrhenica]|uniref:Uncharacterized protein n=1 Tax=Saxophila tyrrhenica TaxID=1690608 RepID=A0AAV9PM64_9PEZI|nr:hypothetical protein LTR77_002469 [Saxophila tyrrhenica]
MPTHATLTIRLHSASAATAAPLPEHTIYSSVPDHDTSGNRITVLLPATPSAQFWLSYACPDPAVAFGEETKFLYFKVVLKGRCVLSWSVGAKDEWKGKAVVGFFEKEGEDDGGMRVEKRGFFFPGPEVLGRDWVSGWQEGMKIHVFRAKGRKRCELAYEAFEEFGGLGSETDGEGAGMQTVGIKQNGDKQRMYTYALVDEKTEPFAKFVWRFCSQEQYNQLFTTRYSNSSLAKLWGDIGPIGSPSLSSTSTVADSDPESETSIRLRLELSAKRAILAPAAGPFSPSPLPRAPEKKASINFSRPFVRARPVRPVLRRMPVYTGPSPLVCQQRMNSWLADVNIHARSPSLRSVATGMAEYAAEPAAPVAAPEKKRASVPQEMGPIVVGQFEPRWRKRQAKADVEHRRFFGLEVGKEGSIKLD